MRYTPAEVIEPYTWKVAQYLVVGGPPVKVLDEDITRVTVRFEALAAPTIFNNFNDYYTVLMAVPDQANPQAVAQGSGLDGVEFTLADYGLALHHPWFVQVPSDVTIPIVVMDVCYRLKRKD